MPTINRLTQTFLGKSDEILLILRERNIFLKTDHTNKKHEDFWHNQNNVRNIFFLLLTIMYKVCVIDNKRMQRILYQ